MSGKTREKIEKIIEKHINGLEAIIDEAVSIKVDRAECHADIISDIACDMLSDLID